MKIEENKTYKFVFPFMGEGFITINVPADSQQDAAVFLKEWMNRVQIELSMAFPEVSQAKATPSEFNQMQIGLLDDLAKACGIKENQALAAFVEEKTGYPMTLENFKLIIPILEGIRDGNIPPNGKKKA